MLYLNPSPNRVDGQIEDKAGNFGDGGDEKGEDQFGGLVIVVFFDQLGNLLHAPLVDADVNKSRDEGRGEGELDPLEQFQFVPFEGGLGVLDGIMMGVLAGFEAG